MSLASLAISVPEIPMANPTSASLKIGAVWSWYCEVYRRWIHLQYTQQLLRAGAIV